MRTNYVLIDYENVQPTSLAGLDVEHFRVLVFVGASQNKLSFDTAAAMQKLGARASSQSMKRRSRMHCLGVRPKFMLGLLTNSPQTTC
jgi:hypothetical protein